MQVLDQASRGPSGALEVFWTVTPGLATVGASLMILSVAFDPFAQQILSYPTRRVRAWNETAYVQTAENYTSSWATGAVDSFTLAIERQLESSMQMAIFSGLAQTNAPLDPVCTSADCEYDEFVTLGVCAECENVTNLTHQSCVPETNFNKTAGSHLWMEKTPTNCTYTSPSGHQLSPKVFEIAGWQILDDGNDDNYDNDDSFIVIRQPWTSSINTKPQSAPNFVPAKLASFFGAKYDFGQVYDPKNCTIPEEKPTLMECCVFFREK